MTIYYTDEHNGYYKQINNKVLELITKEEYYEKSKNNETDIELLKHSVYPCQFSPYILLKLPKFYINNEKNNYNKLLKKAIKNKNADAIEYYKEELIPTNNYVPIDYQLSNLSKFFWKHKLHFSAVDFGHESNLQKEPKETEFEKINVARCNIDCYNNDSIKIIQKIKKLFKNTSNLKIYDFNNLTSEQSEELNKYKNTIFPVMSIANNNPSKVFISCNSTLIIIWYHIELNEWLHKHLEIELPKEQDAKLGDKCITLRWNDYSII